MCYSNNLLFSAQKIMLTRENKQELCPYAKHLELFIISKLIARKDIPELVIFLNKFMLYGSLKIGEISKLRKNLCSNLKCSRKSKMELWILKTTAMLGEACSVVGCSEYGRRKGVDIFKLSLIFIIKLSLIFLILCTLRLQNISLICYLKNGDHLILNVQSYLLNSFPILPFLTVLFFHFVSKHGTN